MFVVCFRQGCDHRFRLGSFVDPRGTLLGFLSIVPGGPSGVFDALDDLLVGATPRLECASSI